MIRVGQVIKQTVRATTPNSSIKGRVMYGVGAGATDFAFSRLTQPDESLANSAGDALLYGAASAYAPWLVAAYEVGQIGALAGELYSSGKKQIKDNEKAYGSNFGSGQAMDNKHAYTQRQRAISMARSARQRSSSYGLGHEARAMHRMQRRA